MTLLSILNCCKGLQTLFDPSCLQPSFKDVQAFQHDRMNGIASMHADIGILIAQCPTALEMTSDMIANLELYKAAYKLLSQATSDAKLLRAGVAGFGTALKPSLVALVSLRTKLAMRKGATMVLETAIRTNLDDHMKVACAEREAHSDVAATLCLDQTFQECLMLADELWPSTKEILTYQKFLADFKSKEAASSCVSAVVTAVREVTPEDCMKAGPAAEKVTTPLDSCPAEVAINAEDAKHLVAFLRDLIDKLSASAALAQESVHIACKLASHSPPILIRR